MKKRIFTLALVVLFALTLVPLIAVADDNLIELTSSPEGVDAPDSHWGWSSREGIDTLPRNMRGITGIIIEFDIESGAAEFVVQSPAYGNWWCHPGATEFDNYRLEVDFAEFTAQVDESWELHNKQYEMHLVFGNWDDAITPDNIVGAWLVGEEWGAPQFAEGDEDPVLAPPARGFGGHDPVDGHWGWSMEVGSLPWNMSEITGIVIEFDHEPGEAEFVVQSPAPGTGWWDHHTTAVEGNTLEIVFADWTEYWPLHAEQNEMHLVFGNWGDLTPDNVVSAQLIGTVAEGIPNPEAEEAAEIPDEGTLPFFMGVGAMIWGDPDNQLGFNGDTRAVAGGEPLAGNTALGVDDGPGGLTARLLVEANWFVVYVDNVPDDYEHEMLQLTIFGNANGWSWEGGTMEAPTIMIYDNGRIAFPISGHPYVEAILAAGEDELDDRNFGVSFTYGGGIANLGVTGVWLYADLPAGAEPEPAPTPEPTPAPTPAPTPEPAPAPADDGFPVWGWVLIAGGAVAVVCVIVVVAKKKGS